MIFHKNVIGFKIGKIDIVGNLDNGSIIGLDSSGKEFCDVLFTQDVPAEELENKNFELYTALSESDFFTPVQEKEELFSAYLHVTQRCNLNCLGCYSLDEDRNHLEDPSLEHLKKAIFELKTMGVKTLIISGGEPFFRKDLHEIVAYANKEVGIQSVHIITNGTVVTEELLEKVKPYVGSIAVSFDGYSAEHPTFIRNEGIFDKLIAAVERIKKAGIRTSILPTVHSKNYNMLREYVALSKKLGVEISFSLLTCSPDNEIFKEYIPNATQLGELGHLLMNLGEDQAVSVMDMPVSTSIDARKSCEVGHKIISIGADGTVYPCHMLHDKELVMGNIFESPLEDIMKSKVANICKNLDVREFTTCKDCEHKFICGGGCRARSYYQNKDFASHDYYCNMTKSFFDLLTEQMNSMYAE